jgi:hypothetical protein
MVENASNGARPSNKEPNQSAIIETTSNQLAQETPGCDSETAMQDDCCKLPEASACCQGDCCGVLTEKPQSDVDSGTNDIVADDDSCAPKSAEPGCDKNCCSSPEPPRAGDTLIPSCCKGKASPCCDVSCLDRLALRECENEDPVAPPAEAFKSKLSAASIVDT